MILHPDSTPLSQHHYNLWAYLIVDIYWDGALFANAVRNPACKNGKSGRFWILVDRILGL